MDGDGLDVAMGILIPSVAATLSQPWTVADWP